MSRYDRARAFRILMKKAVTLKRISFDLSNDDYMTNSERTAFQFDKAIHGIWQLAKEEQVQGLAETTPAVCDALMMLDRHNVLIEFKNGRMPKKTVINIHRKIHDSVRVYSYLTGKSIAENAGELVFLLVYNEEKNSRPDCLYEPQYLPNTLRTPRRERIWCGLGQYEGIYFKEVHTYTMAEFEEYLNRLPSVPPLSDWEAYLEQFPQNPLLN